MSLFVSPRRTLTAPVASTRASSVLLSSTLGRRASAAALEEAATAEELVEDAEEELDMSVEDNIDAAAEFQAASNLFTTAATKQIKSSTLAEEAQLQASMSKRLSKEAKRSAQSARAAAAADPTGVQTAVFLAEAIEKSRRASALARDAEATALAAQEEEVSQNALIEQADDALAAGEAETIEALEHQLTADEETVEAAATASRSLKLSAAAQAATAEALLEEEELAEEAVQNAIEAEIAEEAATATASGAVTVSKISTASLRRISRENPAVAVNTRKIQNMQDAESLIEQLKSLRETYSVTLETIRSQTALIEAAQQQLGELIIGWQDNVNEARRLKLVAEAKDELIKREAYIAADQACKAAQRVLQTTQSVGTAATPLPTRRETIKAAKISATRRSASPARVVSAAADLATAAADAEVEAAELTAARRRLETLL